MKKYVCNICGWIYEEALGDPDHGIVAVQRVLPAEMQQVISGCHHHLLPIGTLQIQRSSRIALPPDGGTHGRSLLADFTIVSPKIAAQCITALGGL